MRNKLLWISTLLVIAVLVTSALSVFILSGHSCSGDGDTECAFCAACEAFGRIKMLIGSSAVFHSLIPCLLIILAAGSLADMPKPTLIALKVKLSD